MINLIKERCVWIDYAKFFSIYLVVIFHTHPYLLLDGFIGNFFILLRMPAFFLIAGFLFRLDKFDSFFSFLKHRSKQLLIPYISFFVIFYLLWLAVGRNMLGDDELLINVWHPIKELYLGIPSIICAPYWFVICLFTMQVLYYFINKYISKKYIFPFTILLSIICTHIDITNIWQLSMSIKYMPFYAFANNYKSFINNVNFKDNKKLIITTGLVVIGTLLVSKENIFMSNNMVMYLLLSVLIMPLYISFCKWISICGGKNKYIEIFAKNGIIILALHNYVIGILKFLSNHILGYNIFEISILLNTLFALIIIIILYYPIILINKYIPFIIGKKVDNNNL